MFRILKKQTLGPAVCRMVVEAPLVAKKALAGQFVIVRPSEGSERIPLTIAGTEPGTGGVEIIFQTVGATTMRLGMKEEGEFVQDLAGPLGNPTDVEGVRKAAVIGGGVGCAIALPVARRLHALGAEVTSVVGFRSSGLVLLEEEFRAASSRYFLTTDDGSAGEKGNVCIPLTRLLESGERFDAVYAVGPLVMMKFVARATLPYGIRTVASMNPIMIDGTGMCGCCRVTVGGEMRFACVDGPDFDAHLIDFDEAIGRSKTYAAFEAEAREKTCRLFRKEIQ